jgi:hypothetical protein
MNFLSGYYESVPAMGRERSLFLPFLSPLGFWCIRTEGLVSFTQVPRENVWKVGGGFLIACVSCLKRARWDIFALFWLLAILQMEAYWDFPDSL